MKINDLKDFKAKYKSDIFFDFDIKKLNWFNIGGKTKVFFKPKSLKELKDFLVLYSNRGKIFILGLGSNVLFSDKLYNGLVIKLTSTFATLSKLNNDTIIVGSSCSQKKFADFAMENNISGFEFMYCIPGSIGGGLKMNSGCFGKKFKDHLLSLQCINKNGAIKVIPANKIKFNYKNIELDEKLIFLSATFKGKVSEKNRIKLLMNKLLKKKNNSQPSKIKTSGSTFKNPIEQTNKKAWELIRDSVPDDIKFGDAEISEKHSNFFINKNNATFSQMNSLINFVKKKLRKKLE